jgi:excisionase family DNA binding protein
VLRSGHLNNLALNDAKPSSTAGVSATGISLRDAAERLGVHYMTAYRDVRTGRLPASRNGVRWRIDPS